MGWTSLTVGLQIRTGRDSESVSGALSNTLAHARRIHRAMGTLTRRDHGRERSHHPPARPAPTSCDANANRDTRSRRPPHARQPSRRPSRGRSRCHPNPILGRGLASARVTDEQPAHGTVYVPPWVEMERPSQPNVAHMDAIQRQLRRKRARNPRGSPVGSTREPRHLRLPNAPSTLSDGEKQ